MIPLPFILFDLWLGMTVELAVSTTLRLSGATFRAAIPEYMR